MMAPTLQWHAHFGGLLGGGAVAQTAGGAVHRGLAAIVGRH
jgi:hypothetical protein